MEHKELFDTNLSVGSVQIEPPEIETGAVRLLSQSLWSWKICAQERIGRLIKKWEILCFHVVLLALEWTRIWSRSQRPKWYKAPPKCAASSKGSPVKALQAMFYEGLGEKPACLCLTAMSMCLLCVHSHAAGLEESFTAVSNGSEENLILATFKTDKILPHGK